MLQTLAEKTVTPSIIFNIYFMKLMEWNKQNIAGLLFFLPKSLVLFKTITLKKGCTVCTKTSCCCELMEWMHDWTGIQWMKTLWYGSCCTDGIAAVEKDIILKCSKQINMEDLKKKSVLQQSKQEQIWKQNMIYT